MEALSIEEREAAANAMLEARKANEAMASMSVKAIQSHYLENPQLKAFNKELRNIGFQKARKSVKLGTVEETNAEIVSYFELCDNYNQLPSIKSLCLYLGISVPTYNSYLRDIDSEYSEVFRAAIDYIHSVIEGGAMNNKVNPATYMFTASNYYGMRDSKQIDIAAVAPNQNNAMSSRDSLNALREQLQKEKAEGAIDVDFVEKDDLGDE